MLYEVITFIQCATHGALFRLVDGLCVYGPCAGEYLTAVAMAVVDGDVVLVTADSESRVARD